MSWKGWKLSYNKHSHLYFIANGDYVGVGKSIREAKMNVIKISWAGVIDNG